MPLQGTAFEEGNLTSQTWQEIAENSMNIVTFERIIEEFNLVEPENEEDKLPDQLSEVANTVLYISLGIKSVKSHREEFERLFGQATSLVVVFWQSYNDSGIPGSRWPPPYLREVIDRLVNTVYFIHKLVKRKSQKSFTKRMLMGYFGLRDLGKFKKYQRKLGAVASGFQGEVNINGVLLDLIKNRGQHQIEHDCSDEGEHSETSMETAESGRAAEQEALAESSRLRKGKTKHVEVEDSSSEKNSTRRQQETQPEPKGNRGTKKNVSKGKGHQESDEDMDEGTSGQDSRTNNAAQSKTKKRETPIDDPSAPKQKAKSTFTTNNGVKEGTFRQGSRTNNTAPSKTRRRESPVHDDDDDDYDEDSEYYTAPPVVDPVTSSEQQQPKKKKKKPSLAPKQKATSAPVSPQYAISGFTFNNGSGNMVNENVGNIHDLTVKDAYNDNSVNTYYAPSERRKPA